MEKMNKEEDRNQHPENQPTNGRVEETILANLLEALEETGGYNESLLHQTIKKHLANKPKK